MTSMRAAAPPAARALVVVYLALNAVLLAGVAALDTGSSPEPGTSDER